MLGQGCRTAVSPDGHSLRCGQSAPPTASQASAPGVAIETQLCSNDANVSGRTAAPTYSCPSPKLRKTLIFARVTMLPASLHAIHFKHILNFGEGQDRLEARVTPEQKKMIARAAALRGSSVTDRSCERPTGGGRYDQGLRASHSARRGARRFCECGFASSGAQ